jgi:hypothetical protein
MERHSIKAHPPRGIGRHSVWVSPTFAADSTLFAFAWGPVVPRGESVPLPQGAVFVSRDRGATWSTVHSFPGGTFGRFALSPRFAEYGVALFAANSGASPGSSVCTLLRTSDWGTSWSTGVYTHGYDTCKDVEIFQVGAQRLEAWLTNHEPPREKWRLHSLRGWSHEPTTPIPTRAP